MEKKISVVIPTYNRPHLLGNCLKALFNQTLATGEYEIIVVSDSHDPKTEKVVEQFKLEKVIDISFYSLEKKMGPAAARNLGWKNAKGILIAFTDDDCLPDTNWLASTWQLYKQESLVAYTGKVTVPVSEKPTDFELNTAGLETAEFVTANCIISKQALIETGGFDEQFTAAWREDSDLHFKLLINNIPVYKNTRAVVIHPVRHAPWGVSLKEQKKTVFNALLYKKYPQLFRQRIKPRPTWFYYVATLLFILGVVSCFAHALKVALICCTIWLAIALRFSAKRLSRTSKTFDHVAEMVVTSMFIPILSVYWTLYGSLKYRVLFL